MIKDILSKYLKESKQSDAKNKVIAAIKNATKKSQLKDVNKKITDYLVFFGDTKGKEEKELQGMWDTKKKELK